MSVSADLRELDKKILTIKQLLLDLESQADQFPALDRNTKRALTSVKMLELNISDVVDLMDT